MTNITIKNDDKNGKLWQDYQELKKNHQMLFPTEGSKVLGVSELELMLSSPHSRYLGGEVVDMLNALTEIPVDRLESIVRNDNAVSEKVGKYQNLNINRQMGLMLNVGGLDLRYFVSKWKHMLAIDNDSNPKRKIYSIQFFDGQGNAINKVYLKDHDDIEKMQAWQELIRSHISKLDDNGVHHIELDERDIQQPWKLNTLSDDNLQILHEKWRSMTDVHQFFGILKNLELDRASSYVQAPDSLAVQLKNDSFETFIHRVRDAQLPIMIFVGNTGVVQIQTGTIQTIKRIPERGEWINILDKDHNDFTLHLKDSAIAQLWCVRRPIDVGYVTCVEAFDDKGQTIITVFGQRTEGNPELPEWVELTDTLIDDFQI